jgi:hypothetical protein
LRARRAKFFNRDAAKKERNASAINKQGHTLVIIITLPCRALVDARKARISIHVSSRAVVQRGWMVRGHFQRSTRFNSISIQHITRTEHWHSTGTASTTRACNKIKITNRKPQFRVLGSINSRLASWPWSQGEHEHEQKHKSPSKSTQTRKENGERRLCLLIWQLASGLLGILDNILMTWDAKKKESQILLGGVII